MFLVIGGVDENWNTLESTEVYDPSVGSWVVAGAKLPRPMSGQRAINILNKVLIFGNVSFFMISKLQG